METLRYFFGSNSDPLKWITANAVAIIAVVTSIRLGWIGRRGSKLLPGDEVIAKIWTRSVFLVAGVIFVFMYKFMAQREEILGGITLVFLVTALISLFLLTRILKRFGIMFETRGWFKRKISIIKLGGDALTPEAAKLKCEKQLSMRALLKEANGRIETLFTVESITKIHQRASVYFIIFQSTATIALCGASLLLGKL
jgi:hypothetical protein